MYLLYPLCEYNGKKLFPKTNRKEECYFVGKFRIRIDRIINFREIETTNTKYSSNKEIRFQGDLLEILGRIS